MSNFVGLGVIANAFNANLDIKPYDDVREKNLSGMDLRGKSDLLFTLTFDNLTKWPQKDKMPGDFDPAKLLELGKKPGLGIDSLHKQGYTGTGVTIAYVDQHLLLGHEAYQNVNLHNYEIQNDNIQPSMHGPAVLSLLAGKDSGIVPNAEVYFFSHNGMKDDNEYEAKAFEKIVELNKTLPENKKIKIVGMSHAADDSLSVANAEHLRAAQEAARQSGIIVVDVSCGMSTCGVQGFKDRDDYKNYQISHWEEQINPDNFNNQLLVPADFRTTAEGYKGDPRQYAYWGNGGFSWGVPYITGVIAMGLQIDPKLTEKEAFEYLHESSHSYLNGDMINPEGFLKLVKQNFTLKNTTNDYYYLLYNSTKISANDKIAIDDYADRLAGNGSNYILKDVASLQSATDIYKDLKQQSSLYSGKLKGIQIFGSSSDVPAFDIHYKVKVQNGIDDSGNFKSDLFYGNFNSDASSLENDFSIYKAFDEKLSVDFVPQWSVDRLPLSAGEIAPFINKYYDYRSSMKGDKVPYINFSNPIFAQQTHSDDMGYFIKERLDKEFKILKPSDYKLYGNKQGLFPVTTDVAGGFDIENLKAENQKGIANFFINSHGQLDNIDSCIFINQNDLAKYKDKIRISNPVNGNSNLLELRIPFLNISNINSILSKNYYTLTLWTCSNGYDLRNDNLAHEALASGKAIDAMAASSTISNNGVNNTASLTDLKKNNFYYFMYEFFKYQSDGYSRSDSFFNAKRLYAAEILKHIDLLGEGNYGYNLHNVLSYHYLGVIDIPESQSTGMIELPAKDILPKANNSSLDKQNNTRHIILNQGDSSDDLNYKNITYRLDNPNEEYKVQDISAAVDQDKVYIKIKYSSPKDDFIALFLQGDTPGLQELIVSGTKKGDNTMVLSFTKDELKNYKAGLAVNIGSRNFVFIDKNTMDELCE